jgi:hypothetical protein
MLKGATILLKVFKAVGMFPYVEGLEKNVQFAAGFIAEQVACLAGGERAGAVSLK